MFCLFWNVYVCFLVSHWEKYNTGVLYLPRGYDFSVITSFLMYLITALYNINQSYKDVRQKTVI